MVQLRLADSRFNQSVSGSRFSQTVTFVAVLSLALTVSSSVSAQESNVPSPPAGAPAARPASAPPTSAPAGADAPTAAPTGEAATPDAPLTDAERFRRGRNHFEFGDCKKVIETLEPLSLPGRLSDDERLIETHWMLGVCYYQQDRKKLAAKELTRLLFIDSDYVLDPFLTPPPVVELFADLRVEVKRKEEEIKANEKVSQPKPSLIIEREVVEQEVPLYAILIPFGGAQLMNGEPIKASVLGGLQLATIAVNLGAFATVQTIGVVNGGTTFPSDGISSENPPLMNAFIGASVVAGVALLGFGLTYGYSIADAWWNWTPRREISRTEDRREATKDDQKRLR